MSDVALLGGGGGGSGAPAADSQTVRKPFFHQRGINCPAVLSSSFRHSASTAGVNSLSAKADQQQRSLGRVVVRRPTSFRMVSASSGESGSTAVLVRNAEPLDSITTVPNDDDDVEDLFYSVPVSNASVVTGAAATRDEAVSMVSSMNTVETRFDSSDCYSTLDRRSTVGLIGAEAAREAEEAAVGDEGGVEARNLDVVVPPQQQAQQGEGATVMLDLDTTTSVI